DGPRRRREEGRGDHGAFRQGQGRLGRREAAAQVHPAAHRRGRGRHGDHRSRRVYDRPRRRRHDADRTRARCDARGDQGQDGGELQGREHLDALKRPRKRHRGSPSCTGVAGRYSRPATPLLPETLVPAAIGLKRLSLALAAVFAAGIAALVAVSAFIPAEKVRNAVIAEIRSVTGLEPVVRGEVAVSLFPTATVTFSDVTLGDDRDTAPALTADKLTATLRLLPLL